MIGRLQPAFRAIADAAPHGSRSRYVGGCRCGACKRAHADYQAARRTARQRGERNELIDAMPVRQHIWKLSRAGVGARIVADAARVPESTVWALRYEIRRRVRRQTAERILAVSLACRADRTLVPADGAWRKIARLLDEGYSRGAIARMMGQRHSWLQLQRYKITVRNRAKVDSIYKRLMT